MISKKYAFMMIGLISISGLSCGYYKHEKCKNFCMEVIKRTPSWGGTIEGCQSSCKIIDKTSWDVPTFVFLGNVDCRESCKSQCSYAEPCPKAAYCYKSCLDKLSKQIPNRLWYHTSFIKPDDAICYEKKCVNQDCPSLFSKPTPRQEAGLHDPKDNCYICYEKCTSH